DTRIFSPLLYQLSYGTIRRYFRKNWGASRFCVAKVGIIFGLTKFFKRFIFSPTSSQAAF
ncbi:MAG: hypothetical protein SO168_08180, partial [Muribaculaceae bacterium]|nr:hypothetical protein [Muribaculaceae bacterium]